MKTPRIYTLHNTAGNTTITGIHEGRISMWVARMGGDDLDLERLLLDGSVTINKDILTLKEETPTPTLKK
jgi:hypothetical protein